ncbi:MAG: DNA polymerase III subunit gamma/tau [Pseudomonadota bacterium]
MDSPGTNQPAYRVLARKYRPSDFSALIGQGPMVRTLTNAFEQDRIAQAWMLTGVRGVGKTTTARILARALNYKRDGIDKPSVDLSEPGEHCQAILEGRHMDIIEMDAASHTGIDDIKQIIDGVRYSPVSARYKVYIIDEIHMLSEKAFNALLKTLEEPPPHAKFIFATTEIRKVPVTVLSRCQRFDLRRIEPQQMVDHLAFIAGEEQIEAEPDALALIARAGEGSVRDCLSILDQAIAHSAGTVTAEAVRAMLGLADRARIVDLFEHLMSGRVPEALSELRSQYDAGADPTVIMADLASFTHLVSRLRYVPESAARDVSLSPDERERGLNFAEKLPVSVLARTWQMLLKGMPEVEGASRPIAAAEMVLIRIGHASTLPTLDDALKKLEDAPSSGANVTRDLSAPTTASPVASASAQPVEQAPQTSPIASGGGATAMRLVASQPEPTENDVPMVAEHKDEALPEPKEIIPPESTVPITSMHDLAELAAENREPGLRAQIRQNLRPVSFGDGRIEVNLVDGGDRNLVGILSQRLKDWTGRHWMVTVSNKDGGPTLKEEDQAQRSALLEDAGRDPVVSQLLSAFPGSKVVDVRYNRDELEDENLTIDPADLPAEGDQDI